MRRKSPATSCCQCHKASPVKDYCLCAKPGVKGRQTRQPAARYSRGSCSNTAPVSSPHTRAKSRNGKHVRSYLRLILQERRLGHNTNRFDESSDLVVLHTGYSRQLSFIGHHTENKSLKIRFCTTLVQKYCRNCCFQDSYMPSKIRDLNCYFTASSFEYRPKKHVTLLILQLGKIKSDID